jgi:hypothetical protein
MRIAGLLFIAGLTMSIRALTPDHNIIVAWVTFLGQWAVFSFAVVLLLGSMFLPGGQPMTHKPADKVVSDGK